jgi:hypothetical protein
MYFSNRRFSSSNQWKRRIEVYSIWKLLKHVNTALVYLNCRCKKFPAFMKLEVTLFTNSRTVQFTTARTKASQSVVSSPVVAWWRILTMSFTSVLTFLPVCDCLVTNSFRVRITLRLTVSRQLFRLGDKPLEYHDQIFFNWTLTVIVLI